jgi:hypothetical protein
MSPPPNFFTRASYENPPGDVDGTNCKDEPSFYILRKNMTKPDKRLLNLENMTFKRKEEECKLCE